MHRDLSLLSRQPFDLLVVGGGVYGACIAWDASLRGLSVALLERGDFGAATSANSLRIVHGGLRYLSRGDFPRMLESIRERSALLRIAPQLVSALPILIPTYSRPLQRNRLATGIALAANDTLSWAGNRGLHPTQRIPGSRLVTPAESRRLFPWFPQERLTGGALWFDAAMVHPERLTWSFVCSATRQGAVAANYVAVDRLLVRDGRVHGAEVTDLLQGRALEVRSRTVVVAAGPWTDSLIACTLGSGRKAGRRALALNVVLRRQTGQTAIGVQARSGSAEDPVCGGRRFLFMTPQAGGSLLGTWYRECSSSADVASQCEEGVRRLLAEFNEACPGLDLTASDVAGYQWGLVPLKGAAEAGRDGALAERPRVIDHAKAGGIRHLLSVEGVKYTTARAVAERAVDWVFQTRGQHPPRCQTSTTRLEHHALAREAGQTVSPGDVVHAIREEMAVRLSDITRRTVASPVPLSRSALADVARVAAPLLSWSREQEEREVEETLHRAGATTAMESVG